MEAQDSADWVISMTEKLQEAQAYAADHPRGKWCIYQVPRRLRDAQDNKVYVPQTVSIGPYHHADEHVRSTNHHKWIALDRILKHSRQDLKVYIDSIKLVEKEARSCYKQDVGHLTDYQFVEMMILDGCFILELFRCSPKDVGDLLNSELPTVFDQRMIYDVMLDMVMLENQIPLFILDRLFGLICPHSGIPGDPPKVQATDFNK